MRLDRQQNGRYDCSTKVIGCHVYPGESKLPSSQDDPVEEYESYIMIIVLRLHGKAYSMHDSKAVLPV